MDTDTQETSDRPPEDAESTVGMDDDAVEGDDVAERDGDAAASREVVVPMRVYKTVTVFSTLIAVVAVIAGFALLDSATNRATASLDEVNVLLALGGLGCIVLGAATYAFSTRFRTEGMGKSNDDAAEESDNG